MDTGCVVSTPSKNLPTARGPVPVTLSFGGLQALARTPDEPVRSDASSSDSDEPEMRIASNGTACYTRDKFLALYGNTDWPALWDQTDPSSSDGESSGDL